MFLYPRVLQDGVDTELILQHNSCYSNPIFNRWLVLPCPWWLSKAGLRFLIESLKLVILCCGAWRSPRILWEFFSLHWTFASKLRDWSSPLCFHLACVHLWAPRTAPLEWPPSAQDPNMINTLWIVECYSISCLIQCVRFFYGGGFKGSWWKFPVLLSRSVCDLMGLLKERELASQPLEDRWISSQNPALKNLTLSSGV